MFVEGSIGITFNSFSMLFEAQQISQEEKNPGTAAAQKQPPHGAPICVTEVFPDGQAHGFGLKRCDLITALNGERLPADMTNDGFFEVLVGAPRPVAISFRRQATAR
jgi:hypothetical protein